MPDAHSPAMTPISTIITPLLCAQIDPISACAYDQIKSWAALEKKSGKKIHFLSFFFSECLNFTPTKYRYQHERKKSSEFFL